MKTKYILITILIYFFYLPLQAAIYTIDQTQTISLTTGYINGMNETWNIVSTVADKPLKITYTTSTETNFDFVSIYNIDNAGIATKIITLSGQQSGSISTIFPNGKAKVVFTSDASVSYSTVYTGINISFAADIPMVISSNINISGNTYINGNLGLGTIIPTKKFEIWDGNSGRFTFSAPNCTSGYEVAQTIDDTGYKLNVGGYKNYKIAVYGTDQLTILNNGNVGIGTTPNAKLDIKGNSLTSYINFSGTGTGNIKMGTAGVAGEYGGVWLNQSSPTLFNYAILAGTGMTILNSQAGGYLYFTEANVAKMTIKDGKVGIGTIAPDQMLTIKGKIHAEEVIIDLNVPIADYVFKPTYKLMPLTQVEQYVNKNNHLPEIPSATEIKKNGLSMGEMQNKLLQKVEELTLYLIEQQKRIEQLEKNQK